MSIALECLFVLDQISRNHVIGVKHDELGWANGGAISKWNGISCNEGSIQWISELERHAKRQRQTFPGQIVLHIVGACCVWLHHHCILVLKRTVVDGFVVANFQNAVQFGFTQKQVVELFGVVAVVHQVVGQFNSLCRWSEQW